MHPKQANRKMGMGRLEPSKHSRIGALPDSEIGHGRHTDGVSICRSSDLFSGCRR